GFLEPDEGYAGWVLEQVEPAAAGLPDLRVAARIDAPDEIRRAMAAYRASPARADELRIRLTSPPFRIAGRTATFAVGGGADVRHLRVSLRVDGQEVRWATGSGGPGLSPRTWDVSPWKGRTGVLVIADELASPGGHLWVERLRFAD